MQCCGSKYGTLNFDPGPGFWPHLDLDPIPRLCQYLKKVLKIVLEEKNPFQQTFFKKEIKRIMAPEVGSLSGEFLSSILHLLPLILIYPFLPVWIRIPKVAEYRFNLDPDPNSST